MRNTLIELGDLLLIESGGAVRRGDEIHAPDGSCGFLTYGPYRQLPGGLYKATLLLGRLEGEIGRFTLDVFSNGSILAETDFLNASSKVELVFVAPSENLMEFRITGYGTPIVVTDLSVTSISTLELNRPPEPWRSLVGEAVLEEIIEAGPRAAGARLTVPRAIELLFDSKRMLKVALPDLNEAHDELVQRGVDPILARAMFEDVGFSDWEGSDEAVDSLIAFPPVRHSFQSQILQEGRLRALCPVTRQPMESVSSIPIVAADHLPIVYEFLSGPAPAIMFANAGWGGAISFIWLVKQDVFLIDDRNWCIGFDGPGLVAQYLQTCLQYQDQLSTYRNAEKTVAVVSGYQPNLGHFYWNDVSGLEREYRLGRLGRAAQFYHRPNIWTGIADLYPEFVDRVRPLDPAQLITTVMDERRLLVRPTGSAVDAELSARVRSAAITRLRAQAPERLEAVRKQLAVPGTYKLFLNLRAHNKSWNQQVDGMSQVIEHLINRTRDLVVYLDGMPDCREVADALIERFGSRCTFVDGLTVGFAETLLWCFGCDAFIAVIGSGLVPLTWLADRPGVAHSNIGHHDQIASFWKRVRRNEAPLYIPDIEQIQDDGPGIYANYNIDPDVIFELFSKVMNHGSVASRSKGRGGKLLSKVKRAIRPDADLWRI